MSFMCRSSWSHVSSTFSFPCRLTSILLSRLILDLHAYPTHDEVRVSGVLSTIQFVENEDQKQEDPEQSILHPSLLESGTTVQFAQGSDGIQHEC